MKIFLRYSLISCTLCLSISQHVHAVEGASGRPSTGMQVVPLNAVLPSEEGGILSLVSVYYDGSLSASKQVPIAGQLVGGIDYQLSYNLLNGVFIWKTSPEWTFATSVGVPVQYTNIRSYVNDRERQESATKIGDVMFSPIIANYHINPIMHVLFGVNIYAPTGSYDPNKLSNASLNTWTFVPNMAMTTILPKLKTELTANMGYEFYTKNEATDYKNGEMFRLDLLGLKRFESGLGLGVVGGMIYQTTDDDSRFSERLDGFKGRSYVVGPILTYEKKLGQGYSLSLSARGVHEFDVQNRPEGTAYQLNVSLQY